MSELTEYEFKLEGMLRDLRSELAAKDKEIEGYKESLSIAYEAERKLRDELQVLKAQRK
jgi:hypothetical protein